MNKALAPMITLAIFSFVCASANSKKSNVRQPDHNKDFYGFNYQHIHVNDIYSSTNDNDNIKEIGNHANAVGFFYKSIVKHYLHLELGTDYVMLNDKNPFITTVNEGDRADQKESSVYGYSLYIEAGLASHFKNNLPLNIGTSLGYRHNDIKRSIFRCSGCQEVELPKLKDAFYVKPFIEYTFHGGGLVQLYKTYYSEHDSFESGVGLRLAARIF